MALRDASRVRRRARVKLIRAVDQLRRSMVGLSPDHPSLAMPAPAPSAAVATEHTPPPEEPTERRSAFSASRYGKSTASADGPDGSGGSEAEPADDGEDEDEFDPQAADSDEGRSEGSEEQTRMPQSRSAR